MSLLRPDPGELLISSHLQTDGPFEGTVLLVLDSDADGALAVVLNRFSDLELESVLPGWEDRVSPPQILFDGGPVSPNGAICLAALADTGEDPPGWRRLFDDVGLLHLDTPLEIVEGAYADLRIFAGYAGWEPDQLEQEIAAGAWWVAPARYDDVFGADPEAAWRRVLRRQPPPMAWLSTLPTDPEEN